MSDPIWKHTRDVETWDGICGARKCIPINDHDYRTRRWVEVTCVAPPGHWRPSKPAAAEEMKP